MKIKIFIALFFSFVLLNFTGVNGEYETPSNPDLIIDTEKSSLVEEVIKIIQYLKSRELIPSTN